MNYNYPQLIWEETKVTRSEVTLQKLDFGWQSDREYGSWTLKENLYITHLERA